MKVVLKLNNKLSVGIAPGASSKGLWGAIQGEIENQKDLVEYVDNKILGIDHTEYVTETELEAKGYLTTIPEEYAKKSDIPDVSAFITEIPEEYITSEELEAKGYLTEHQDISHLATKEELSGYQVKGDYLTSIPEEYAKKSDIPDTSKFITEIPEEYAKKSDIPDTSSFITTIPEEYITETELTAKGYATQAEMNAALGDIEAVLDEIIGEETV